MEPNGAEPFDGNTSHQKARVVQKYHWFFTWNNYPNDFDKILEPRFRQICNGYEFQEETGESGTNHLQGNIHLKKKMRWTEFNLPKTIHWEVTRNVDASAKYCTKDQSRSGKQFIWPEPPKPIKIITELRPWQKSILDIISQEPDERKIHWFWESQGGIGKSVFTKYLVYHHNALFCCGGKFKDLINLIFLNDMDKCNLIVFDIPRSHGGNISYDTLECIKNGLVCNTKYETGVKLFNVPHLIIFANFPPENEEKLSSDRWSIINLIAE